MSRSEPNLLTQAVSSTVQTHGRCDPAGMSRNRMQHRGRASLRPLPDDIYLALEPWPRIGRPPKHDFAAWNVTDDWPEHVLVTDAEVAVLLRLAFLESRQRHAWWQDHPVDALYVLSQRPSFTGRGTDATSYGVFVYRGTDRGIFVI